MTDGKAGDRPLTILMHCVYFPPEVGGLESHVFYLCRALVEMGHRVIMITSRSKPEAAVHEVMDGIEVYRTWFPARNPIGWGLHAFGSIPRVQEFAQEADILHAQAFASVVPLLRGRARKTQPLVTTWHTSHFLMRADSPVWRPIFGRMLRAADHNLAASQEIADVGERIAPGTRVEALTNGVETERFRPVSPALDAPEGGRRRLVVPRRLFEKNGVEFAVRALPLIAESHDVEMLFVGDGPERERLESLAAELGVTDRAHFMGARPNTEMPGLLCSGEVAVFPSLMEATSVAALECLACQVPVAASNVGGLPEIIDDGVGGLFEPADPAGLAARVCTLLDDPELESRGAEGRRRVVDRWSNRRLAARHLDIYRGLTDREETG